MVGYTYQGLVLHAVTMYRLVCMHIPFMCIQWVCRRCGSKRHVCINYVCMIFMAALVVLYSLLVQSRTTNCYHNLLSMHLLMNTEYTSTIFCILNQLRNILQGRSLQCSVLRINHLPPLRWSKISYKRQLVCKCDIRKTPFIYIYIVFNSIHTLVFAYILIFDNMIIPFFISLILTFHVEPYFCQVLLYFPFP